MEEQPHFKESIEVEKYTPSEEVVNDFMNLSPEAADTFRSRLEGVDGHLRIWVHPLYTKQLPSSTWGRLGNHELSEIQEKIQESFYRTNESVLRNPTSSPLVVYEPKIYLEKTKELVASHLDCDPSELETQGIVFIPTERDTSVPDFAHYMSALQSGDEQDNAMADDIMTFRNAVDQLAAYEDTLIPKLLAKLPQLKEDPYTLLIEDEQIVQLDVLRMHAEGKSDLTEEYKEARDLPTIDSESLALYSLRHLGMESALVSGAYLESSQNPMSKENHFSACAGAVVNQLRNNGIPTDISANIWPPKDQLREAGHEMKQTGQAGFTVDKFYK